MNWPPWVIRNADRIAEGLTFTAGLFCFVVGVAGFSRPAAAIATGVVLMGVSVVSVHRGKRR